MPNQQHPVAHEGYPFIGLFAFVTLVFALLGWTLLTLLCLGLTLFTCYFFRNPERVVPDQEGVLVAPADGQVVFVGEVDEERYFQQRVTKVSIFMSVFNVHINRNPCSGKVIDMFYNRGQFLNASYDKASQDNEQAGLLLQTEDGQQLLVVQIAGLIARRIVTYPLIGDQLQRGERFGLIRFGSRVDLYLPPGSEVSVTLGEKTLAGETVVGSLP